MFRKVTLEQRLAASNIGAENNNLDIECVDVGFGDIKTPVDWEETCKVIV